MNPFSRPKLYLLLALGVFSIHLFVAALIKPSWTLTLIGDAIPCALLILAILAVSENFRYHIGLLSLFWKLTAACLFAMLLSQAYWFYYDSLRRFGTPSPVLGDSLFLIAHVFFLSALAFRPHSSAAGGDLRFRSLDFFLLTLWWLALYGYFSLPWQVVVQDFSKYNPAYYLLALIQHLVIMGALAVLWWRNADVWRRVYGHLLIAFTLIAAGNLLLSVSIDRGIYYAGGFFDTPFLLAIVWFSYVATFGSSLQPRKDTTPNRELKQTLWTARIAMLAILSLPAIGLIGYLEKNVLQAIADFRLRVVFGATLLLGALLFRKLNLLAHELVQLVRLTHDSIENLKFVQKRVTHTEKLTALGRLAAGTAHEISNPLTAILGYSELLADIPSLSPQDRQYAKTIHQHVHSAQAAVNSLRDTLRKPASPNPIVDKEDAST